MPFFGVAQTPFCYTRVQHIVYNLNGAHDMTINLVDISGGSTVGITLTSCYNIRITRSYIHGINNRGIRLNQCHDITVDSCSFENLTTGIYAFQCTGGIVVKDNQFNNISNPLLASTGIGSAVQYAFGSGGNQKILRNKIQSTPSLGGGDMINLYQTSGLVNDYVDIGFNEILGGGSDYHYGPSGIVACDLAGKYVRVHDNKLVNTGYNGIISQSGTFIVIKNNYIYSADLPYSGTGLGCANYGASPAGFGDTITNNRINWFGGVPAYRRINDTVYKPIVAGHPPNTRPIGFSANVHDNSVNRSLLPATIYQTCSLPAPAYVPVVNILRVGTSFSISPTNSGSAATSWSISPSLVSGLSFNTSTGRINGTPTAQHLLPITYTVTATNGSGSATAPLIISVLPKLPNKVGVRAGGKFGGIINRTH